MTKRQALKALGLLTCAIAAFAATAAHLLWHRGRRISSIFLLTAGAATDAALLASMLIPNFPLTGRTFHRGSSAGNMVALTFDDGPRAPFTDQVLDVLKREGVPATFFVLGENARRHPELVRRMEAEGHRVANHGFSHGILMWAGGAATRAEVTQADAELRAAGVLDPAPLFRAPHGWLSPAAHASIRGLGYGIAGWTKGVWDTANPGVDVIVSRVNEVLKPGSIILLHDGWQGDGAEDRSQTAAALGEIISLARERGMTFVTMEQMMRAEAEKL